MKKKLEKEEEEEIIPLPEMNYRSPQSLLLGHIFF